ncbi:tyrosine-type recombinase/integrase [Bacillus toyonensis]|uniref:tyrosine-type recombinase/integrase n=1 Tax=Bacillus toyonensis TaxID=155322 RepID=UPI0034673D61
MILLSYTGLRVSEALSIKIVDFNLQTGECIIRNGKGEKQQVVLLNSKVVHALGNYFVERKNAVWHHIPLIYLLVKNGRNLIVRLLWISKQRR